MGFSEISSTKAIVPIAELSPRRNIVGCGTAYYAGMLAGYYIEQFTPGITVEPVMLSKR